MLSGQIYFSASPASASTSEELSTGFQFIKSDKSEGISFGISLVVNLTQNGLRLFAPLSKLSTSISPQ